MKILLTVIALAIPLAVFGQQAEASASEAPEAPAPIIYTVRQVSRVQEVKVVGNLDARVDLLLDNEVGGITQTIHVDTGDTVKKDQVLVTLSSLMLEQQLTAMQNQYDNLVDGFAAYKPYFAEQAVENKNELFLGLQQAELNAAFQKQELDRMAVLLKDGTIAPADYDGIKLQYDLALNGVAQARQAIKRQELMIDSLAREIALLEKQISYLEIKAPMSGTIVDVMTEVGEKVPGDPGCNVVHLIDDSVLIFRCGVPEVYFDACRQGNPARIVVAGMAQAITAEVSRVAPLVNAAGRTFQVEIEVPNSDGTLKAGLFATAYMQIKQNGLAVSTDAVIREERGAFVKLENGKRIPVRLNASPQTGEVFVSGPGLTDGTIVIK